MRKPKRLASLFLTVLLAVCGAKSFAAGDAFVAGKTSFYYSVSLGSFSTELFMPAEYSDFSASIDFAKSRPMNLALSAHYLLPVNPLSFDESLAGLGVDLTLFYLQNHPFQWISPRKAALAPMLSAAVLAPITDFTDIRYTLTLSPLRFFSGYGYFSLGAFSLIFQTALSPEGWGLKLFEFSYLLF